MTVPEAVPTVRMTAIEKRFGAVRANRGANLEVRQGEIHALVGENGAGKSTLMRVLSGMYPPDAGTVEVNGRDVTGWSTADAIATGVGMVHQHFMLVPTLTVAENVVLGLEPVRAGRFDRAKQPRARWSSLVRASGLRVPVDRLVGDLSVGEAQRVEILKTLYRGARILLLDEPTAVLSPPEVAELWKVLRRSARRRCDDRAHHAQARRGDRSERARHRHAAGRDRCADGDPRDDARPASRGDGRTRCRPAERTGTRRPHGTGRRARSTKSRCTRHAHRAGGERCVVYRRPGEILGIAGVEGNGQTELIEAIAGLRPITSGTVRLGGVELGSLAVRAHGDAGLSHIPEDRHRRGLILEYTVADNLILGQQHAYTTRGLSAVLDRARITENASRKIAAYDIRPPEPALSAGALSGGNQQKIVIAREMARPFTALLAAQPTRGVDVGAIEFIHEELRRTRDDGKAVLLVSAELREVLTLSDRIAVMYGGRIVAILA